MQRVPHAGFFNLYGPTETNVITYHHVDSVPAEQSRPVPIGKACANMEVFARAADGNIVTQPGEEGELYARGSFVAQGYWGDREKTSQAFLANPDEQLSDRIYRTGDLVTLDENGSYLFIGRRDHMVKRRGYRIELGEIESVLYNHAAVREAAVVAEPDDDNGSRLIAFVVSEADAVLAPSELESHIANWLPKYMVPDEILFQASLPKTSTGKVDRQALLTAQASTEAVGA
jgi:acyl-coenzyme A synthetase/AMP-(fatty) acid ligase